MDGSMLISVDDPLFDDEEKLLEAMLSVLPKITSEMKFTNGPLRENNNGLSSDIFDFYFDGAEKLDTEFPSIPFDLMTTKPLTAQP